MQMITGQLENELQFGTRPYTFNNITVKTVQYKTARLLE